MENVPNIHKLAVLAKVLRRTNAMNDIIKSSPNELELIVNSICNKKSDDVIDALITYKVSSNRINPPLSDKKLMTPEAETKINSLTNYLNKSIIHSDLITYRGEGYNGILNLYKTMDGKPLGKSMEELVIKNASEDEIYDFIDKELIGKRVRQSRFMSATLNKDIAIEWAHIGASKIAHIQSTNGAICWEISAAQNKKGAYIEDFNLMRTMKQNEVIFQRDSQLEIYDAELDVSSKTWIIRAKLIQE